jgi:hypothetical protein
MWNDVVQANVAAVTVMNQEEAAAGRPPARCGHSHYWLEHGYLEQGRIGIAKSVVAGVPRGGQTTRNGGKGARDRRS